MKILEIFFNEFGNYGPIFLFFLSIFILIRKKTFLFYYIIGTFFNSIVNIILKGLIQQSRPNVTIAKSRLQFDVFGMPSGHSQFVFFTTIFIFLSLKEKKILYFFILCSLLIILQRVVYEYHTINQVIIGAIIGIIFGYFMYCISKNKIIGSITEKKN